MRKNRALMAMILATLSYETIPRATSANRPTDRDQRAPDDISARQRKRQEKLARRAKRHAAEANNERGEG